MYQKVCMENVAIVLHDTRIPENIGAAARAAANMGVGQVILSAPRNFDMERVLKVATHSASGLVEAMTVCNTLPEALGTFNWIVGTTARLGGTRRVNFSPADLATKLIPISSENRVAVLFGPEDRGLTNEDLQLCHDLVNIPAAGFSSLNLAQAVMVISYELFKARTREPKFYIPRLACRYELENMYEELQDTFNRIHYINHENPEQRLDKTRSFLSRYQLRSREVSLIRGFCRQVARYGEKCYQDGVTAGAAGGKKTQETR
ncbi:RNA methyltransferase [Desulfobacter hydrogenophilus]|uniref:tRNA (cytidine/uridine-2'-O-)-methyltransferase TrmJ n=1 Tax=Desulfobacter hydrogenophilus TaxID=2291 RepID=A0A328F9F0_9BACT|nr:TrmJ/YjtD family RNA methyltransferase [Desulfobacter hydrogenophilus]NDY73955.1 TrmJ/YjtD family RNA methyltransferase [Desulfobacter hydrogenophilus]QBH14650.1 TrmJ/YjtD family RNA methyltransferase [Desulfobacter hydrogenophilus]RAM00989.1 RNA methyltransferase [Desulfobacter hydrogenophilus]